MRRSHLAMAALATMLWACDDGGSGDPGPGPDSTVGEGGAGGGGGGGEGGAGGGAGGGEGGAGGGVEPIFARSAGRMTIAQLARSIPVVTEGIRWTEDLGNGPADMLQVLAPTLGAPDYLRITEENLEPTLIIAKFVQDAAFRICGRWAERDRGLDVADRSLVQHADWESLDEAEVKANLRALHLRFYAQAIAADDDVPIADLFSLFTDASSTARAGEAARDGWTAICIAMMTDPEFILY
ncbi:MAG: hypothetical protein ACI9U2_003552 [Bradymonadia bacterium]|jgi:hypothetical protein